MSQKALAALLLAFVFASISFSSSFQNSSILSASEHTLIDDSRRAIIETGLSAKYFDAYFSLVTVIDKPSDRRVIWRLSINGYETLITDSIGSYAEGTKQIYTHSVGSALGHTAEIKKTISRGRALKIMKMCIGNFEKPSVEYGRVNDYAQLLLVAHAHMPISEIGIPRERRQRDKNAIASSGTDVVDSEEENEKRTPIKFGSVNLQTGECTRGSGVVAP
jgi:hypothetical protein